MNIFEYCVFYLAFDVTDERMRLVGVAGIKLSQIQEGVESNYACFPVVFDDYKYTRNEFLEKLAEHGRCR